MTEVNRIEKLRDEWGRIGRQVDVARRHPLGFLWLGYLEKKMEGARERYQEEERYLNEQSYKRSKGPFSGIHG